MADVPTEWQASRVYGTYQCVKDADAYGHTSLANASVFSQAPKDEYKQTADISDAGVAQRAQKYLDADGNVIPNNYISFYMGDYDSAAWTASAMIRNFNDPNRGKIPLNWPINPAVVPRAPYAYNYMYEKATEYDVFVGDHNGYGYLEPMSLMSAGRDPGLYGTIDTFLAQTKEAWETMDVEIMGFLIHTIFPVREDVQLKYAQLSPKGVYHMVTTLDGKLIEHEDADGNTIRTPYDSQYYISEGSQQEVVSYLDTSLSTPTTPTFNYYRTVLKTPTFLYNIVDAMWTQRPEYKIEVVDLYVYSYLLARSGKLVSGGM
jgi:hypothetical protein